VFFVAFLAPVPGHGSPLLPQMAIFETTFLAMDDLERHRLWREWRPADRRTIRQARGAARGQPHRRLAADRRRTPRRTLAARARLSLSVQRRGSSDRSSPSAAPIGFGGIPLGRAQAEHFPERHEIDRAVSRKSVSGWEQHAVGRRRRIGRRRRRVVGEDGEGLVAVGGVVEPAHRLEKAAE